MFILFISSDYSVVFLENKYFVGKLRFHDKKSVSKKVGIKILADLRFTQLTNMTTLIIQPRSFANFLNYFFSSQSWLETNIVQ